MTQITGETPRGAGNVVTRSDAAQRGRRLIALVGLLGLAALPALTGCTGSSASAGAKDPVVIGADLSLTGADSELGKVYENALKLEVDRLNARGAVPGRKLTLTIKDDGSNPDTATANIEAFQADGNVAAVVSGPCDACLTATVGPINKDKLPVISLASISPPAPTGATATVAGTALFKLSPNAADDAVTLVGQMSAQGAKKLAVVADTGGYGDAALAALKQAAAKAGITVAGTARLTGTPEAAAQALLGTDQEKAPDAIAVVAAPADATGVVGALHGAGYVGGVYLDSIAADGLFLGTGSPLNSAFLVYPQVMAMDDLVAATPAKAAQKQWFENYTSEYGAYAGPSSFAADAVQLVGMAATASRSVDRAKLRAAIETTSFAGLSGTIQFTPVNHSGLNPQSLTVLRASNGRWHQLTTG
jgi:branched-chain amino acid transport system substrate-binding protein